MYYLSSAESLLKTQGLSCALLQSPADLFYCTGLKISSGTLLVKEEGSFLYVDGRYFELVVQKKLPIQVVLVKKQEDLYTELTNVFSSISGKIGFNPNTMSFATHEKIALCCGEKLLLTPAAAYYSSLRRKKHSDEIEAIQRACALCEKGLTFLLGEIRPGVTERQLAARLKAFWFEHGADALSFEPIIAFDQHTSFPHWSSSETALQQQGTILIDIGVQLNGYQSDMTRMVFLGTPDEELEKCCTIVQGAYEKAFSFIAPGVTPHHLDSIAREFIAEKGYEKFFVHGLGHGLGIEVHEPPKLSLAAINEPPLQVGDVFTLEPGIYLPGRGGVRLENTIVLEEQGARSFFAPPLAPIFLR